MSQNTGHTSTVLDQLRKADEDGDLPDHLAEKYAELEQDAEDQWGKSE